MSEQQNPLERAVDLFVFAPIGVAMFAKDTVPTFLKMFVTRGQSEIESRKKSLTNQANQYRTVGRFAVKYGGPVVKQQAEGKLDEARRLAEETFSGLIVPRGGESVDPKTSPAPTSKPKPVARVSKLEPRGDAGTNGAKNGAASAEKKRATNGKATKPKTAPSVDAAAALAIPGYDQLSASQVVERLDGLTPGELDAVRAYELAHRGRNTILGKITQLTS